jgi:ketosteroid isomerase-like protein
MTKGKFVGVALGVALAASLGACNKTETAKPVVDATKTAGTVKADMAQLVADFNAHDATKSVSQDAPDYVGMFHGQPNVRGPAGDLALTKQQVADPAAKVTVSDETVDVASAGDMAIYRATYAYGFTDPKTRKPMTEVGNWIVGYKQQPDGTMKLAWSVVSDTPAVAPSSK